MTNNQKSATPTIAFIGTGIMGLPMARNLLAAGYPLAVFNRNMEKARALLSDGARGATCPSDAARDAAFVVVMVSDAAAAEAVLFAPDGVASNLADDACVIVCSTLTPQIAREHAARLPAHYLDAPVSGGERGAIDGALAIMVGGHAEVFARAEPLLNVLGNPKHIGASGCGQLAKLVNQSIVGATIAVVAEALLLAEAGGANPQAVRDALLGGFADSAVLRQHGERMLRGDFAPGGPAKYQLRDLQNALAEASEYGAATPMTAVAEQLFAGMMTAGGGELDHAALYQFLKGKSDDAK